ncbi:hypothetical protein L1049_025740 [Liquidambar formosana]|uniref:Uncharacterized protein n=1 Tax=Liquidambar formosana TaxID=63359 RepID=A0AAP0R6M4_LIQFO
MDQHDFKACRMINDARLLCSHENQDKLGKVKSLSDCCGKFTDANTGFEKQDHDSNHGCEAATLPQIERKCPNDDHISSSDRLKGDANNLDRLCSVVSISTNSIVEGGLFAKENCADGTSGAMSGCNGHASSMGQNKLSGDGNLKDGEVSTESLEGTHSARHISRKSDVNSETGKFLNKEEKEFDVMRAKENWVNSDQDGSNSMTQATYHGKQLKTESSSSNSTHVTLPASSIDSCQETSVEAKSCQHSKSSGMNSSICTGFKCSLEEPTVKSLELDIAAQIAPKAPLNTSASQSGKQGSLAKALENVDNMRERDREKVLGMTADENSVIVEKIDISRSSLLKKSNAECPNRDQAKLSYELDDVLEVAWRVAREVEQVVGIYREASGSSSSIEHRNSEPVHLSSVDSADPKKKDYLIKSGHRTKFCNEQDKSDSFYSSKELVDLETSAKNEDLCSQVIEPSKEMSLEMVHGSNDGLHGQVSSQLTTKVEGVANDQIPQFFRFDLNEEIQANEVEYSRQLVNETLSPFHAVTMSMPIRVVAKSGVPTCFPMTPLKFEGVGWRGSAATSAFQPAPFSKSSNRIKASSAKDNYYSLKHLQGFKGIDLNAAAAGDDFAVELSPRKHIPGHSGFPSEDSSVEVSSKQAKRLKFDLNCLGESDDSCPQSSPPASSTKRTIGDFDLNDNPSFGDACNYAHQPGLATESVRNSTLDDRAVFMGNARHPDSNGVRPTYWSDLSSMQGFGHSHAQPFLVATPSVISPVEQMQRVVPLQHTPPPHHAFLYNNGFCIDPTDTVSSTIYASGVLPYVTDQRGMTFIPQILCSSTPPAFPGPPHLMEVAAGRSPPDIAIIRPSFDLNGRASSSENGGGIGNARQLFVPVSNTSMEEQMKSFRQAAVSFTPTNSNTSMEEQLKSFRQASLSFTPTNSNTSMEEQMKSFRQAALSFTPTKRREPEGGWDSQQLGYRQVTSWH